MLMAHRVLLQKLLAQYRALRDLEGQPGSPVASNRLDDVACALRAATGTSDIDAALMTARCHLPGTNVRDDSPLPD